MTYIFVAAMLVLFLLVVGVMYDVTWDRAAFVIYYCLWFVAAYCGTYGIVNILFTPTY